MRSLLAVLLAYALLAPEIGTAQSGTAVGAAVADSAPVAAPAAKKKKGLFGKVKSLANNKIVKTVAKTALCTAVPGGQVIAGALDAVEKKRVTGAASAVTGRGGCTPGMGGMAALGGRGAAGLGGAAAGALGARVPGAGLPGQPFTGMPGMAMSPEQLKQIQEQYAKMGMNPVQLRAMQQMMAGMAGPRSEQATGGMAISPEQLKQAMEQYRKMGMDPAQLAAMQQMRAGMPPASQTAAAATLTTPAASAGSATPAMTTEKGRLVLRQLPWTAGAETIRPGSESAFGVALRKLGAAMLATPKRYKVEARVEEQGGKSPNRLLAQKRAEAVVAALQEQGIAAGRLTVADGGGDKDPRIMITEKK